MTKMIEALGFGERPGVALGHTLLWAKPTTQLQGPKLKIRFGLDEQLRSVSSTRAKENCSTKALPYDHITAKQSSIESSVKRPRTNCVDSILPPDKAKQVRKRRDTSSAQ
uniref:Uncharacterized protein n=2 Tax=Oryza sativa subsp. japonica TaxID=39947 RepID=Q75LT3_ORYSJ|nr:hypothetical protein [Oryza sativa Japonica Group]ABF97206.1 hypothetical protein LOC_Os03g37450 [Oryza sativa Japonica Group]